MEPFNYKEEDKRLVYHPVFRENLEQLYKYQLRAFWTADEVDVSKDEFFYRTADKDTKRFIRYILSFFAQSDELVNVNIQERFLKEIQFPEAQNFYHIQATIENIHKEMYSILLFTMIKNEEEREQLISGASNIPTVKAMTDFIVKCTESEEPLSLRLLRMICVEGVFFTGCFCAIYWIGDTNAEIGFVKSNEFIARDEGIHTNFAIELFNMIRPDMRPSQDSVYKVIKDAYKIAEEFIADALPHKLTNMNKDLMCDYIKSQIDIILEKMHYDKLYNAKHSFAFMNKINAINKTNFFDSRVTEYSKTKETPGEFITEDF